MASSKIVRTSIYITPAGSSKLKLPMNPEKVQVGSDAKFLSYDTIGLGDVKIHRGRSLLEVSWSGKLPGLARRNLPFVTSWINPNTIVKILQRCRDNGTIVTLTITGTSISGQFYISCFKGKHSGGYGDFDYDIKFTEYREIKIYTTKELGKSKPPSKQRGTEPVKKKTPTTTGTITYTIKKGDTLWGIATKYLGKGSRYSEIYKLNKNVIENAAKKHGRSSSNNGLWIYPGTKISIPKK